jgi:hypothetical protein
LLLTIRLVLPGRRNTRKQARRVCLAVTGSGAFLSGDALRDAGWVGR